MMRPTDPTLNFDLTQSHNPLLESTQNQRPIPSTSASSKKPEERKLTGTGKYNIDHELDKMGRGNDSDNYSDEDFYSDQDDDLDEDRDDDSAFNETVKKGGLGEVVNYYEQYLGRNDEDESGTFEDYLPSDSFKL